MIWRIFRTFALWKIELNDMNPIALRLLNQQLVAPQFSDPAEVVSYMGAIQAQDLPYNSDLSDILCLS